jgi:hypothetical protein
MRAEFPKCGNNMANAEISHPRPTFLTLPVEIRLHILEYVLAQEHNTGFVLVTTPNHPKAGLCIDDAYSSSSHLLPLLVCQQFHRDCARLAFRSTHFHITRRSIPPLQRVEILQDWQISALRHLSFIAGAKVLEQMKYWTAGPCNLPNLHLERLDVVLHRKVEWHYPTVFIPDLVSLLRRLINVRTLRFIKNGTIVRGSFKKWYNRLVGLILKEDHKMRYDVPDAPRLPIHWWTWKFDEEGQWFELEAGEPRGVMEEEDYMEMVKPWIQELVKEMEVEE